MGTSSSTAQSQATLPTREQIDDLRARNAALLEQLRQPLRTPRSQAPIEAETPTTQQPAGSLPGSSGDALRIPQSPTPQPAGSLPGSSGNRWRPSRGETLKLSDLDFSGEPALRLHNGPISFDGRVQYGGRTPAEELVQLEKNEPVVYAKALQDQGLPPTTTDYPWPTSSQQAADILTRIEEDEVKLWDDDTGRMIPAVSKGFEGASELHVASLPGADTRVYNNVVLCCLEEQMSFGVVWETNWEKLSIL